MMGPSAIGAQPPPEEMAEWQNPTVHDDPDEPCEWDNSDPFCTCSDGHSIEETDWNQCDSCGKQIYDEEPEWQNDVQAAFGGIVQTPQG